MKRETTYLINFKHGELLPEYEGAHRHLIAVFKSGSPSINTSNRSPMARSAP